MAIINETINVLDFLLITSGQEAGNKGLTAEQLDQFRSAITCLRALNKSGADEYDRLQESKINRR
jgi:hypothetical protein